MVVGLLAAAVVSAQLSPGDLARAHAQLEGMSNCTQCHVLGEKVSNDKCLACHDEISSSIRGKSGYHYSKDVRGKDCATCHSDHHGRNFDMVRFDTDNFNHRLTGYELTGAHKTADCRACHQPDYIDNKELKARKDTWLGLETRCIDCHDDGHRPTLGNDCAKCHATDAFAPAPKFDHAKTDYPLVGKHQTVDCKECHTPELREGKEVMKFSDIPFANCNSCHDDVHNNQLGTNCKQCHTETSFTAAAALRKFNHTPTGFVLKGKHKQVDCFTCHADTGSPRTVFQDRAGIATNACATCHADVHSGKFGTTCADCHTEDGWVGRSIRTDKFNHNLTDFALTGKHQTVDCKQCHVSERMTDPLPHNTCAVCHDDYHKGEFAATTAAAQTPDCAACHVTDGFSPSQFTIEQHAGTAFALDGAHLATPCFACHLQEDQWQFRNIGSRCVDCHDDVHIGEINAKYYPNQTCETCHSTSAWMGDNQFDHNLTKFALAGVHQRTACVDCHKQDTEKPHGRFANLPQDCASCHDNVHGDQFAVAGQTDCRRCHGFDGWEAGTFDHSQTKFPLTGKHAEVACSACHQSATTTEGITRVEYKIARFECRDCHQ